MCAAMPLYGERHFGAVNALQPCAAMVRNLQFKKQCEATTRSGQRCSITEATTLTDRATGVRVSDPLRLGARFCFYHMQFFVSKPPLALDDIELVVLDLETTGLSITRDRIVEIAALDMHGAAFATVVNPGQETPPAAVHGISNEELMNGPKFTEAYGRFLYFLQRLIDTAVQEDSDSSADSTSGLPSLKEPVPQMMLIAHNGFRFDFPLILSECLRHNVDVGNLSSCGFVDSLSVMQALEPERYGGCPKLQCVANRVSTCEGLRAHRALDDCYALREVLLHVAASLGTPIKSLMRHFAVGLDLEASLVHIGTLL